MEKIAYSFVLQPGQAPQAPAFAAGQPMHFSPRFFARYTYPPARPIMAAIMSIMIKFVIMLLHRERILP